MLFGRKKDAGRTLLVLDIEGGSAAASLMRQDTAGGPMRTLGAERLYLPVRQGRSVEALAENILRLAQELAASMSTLAHAHGGATEASIFMSPPWGRPNLTSGAPDFVPHMQHSLTRALAHHFEIPQPRFYTAAGAVAGSMRAALPYEDKYLLVIATHEMTDLLLIHNGAVAGHASIGHGMNLPLRTLKSHGNLSDAEARSALSLRHLDEPLSAAAELYAGEFKSAARELMDMYNPGRVWVVSPAGEYFARTLAHESLADLFPQGGVVRSLQPKHFAAHAGAPQSQDLFLILEAVYLRYI